MDVHLFDTILLYTGGWMRLTALISPSHGIGML